MNLAKNTPDCADVETSSMNYAQRFAGPTGKWLIGVQCSILKDLLNYFNGTESVLDVGGGHGQVVNCLLNSRYKVTVLGSTEKCTVQIESHLKNQKCLFSLGHPENIPYPDKSFDVVTCFRYLSHTEEWQKVISELCRVAKYAVIVDYPPLVSFNLLSPILFKLKKRFEGNTRSFGIFSHKEINSAFLSSGYKLYKRNPQFFFPMVLHRLIKRPGISNRLETIAGLTGLKAVLGSPIISCYTNTQ